MSKNLIQLCPEILLRNQWEEEEQGAAQLMECGR